jgi:hypothetical protein
VSHVNRMMDALTYQGPNRLKKAWLGAVATYTYTRAHDGAVVSDQGGRLYFGRWYSFCAAARIFWEWLWRKDL